MKIRIAGALAVVAGILGASVALAATTVSFTPTSVSVKAGQQVTLSVAVNPAGVKNYTVKTALKFPADLLEVSSFTFAPNWIALAQPGYDLVDNVGGTLIKTAGYPAGTAAQTQFGTVTFKTKKAGNGTIALVAADSLALSSTNQNLLDAAAVSAPVTVTAAAVAPAPAPKPKTVAPQTTPAPISGSQTQTTGQQGQVVPPAAAPAPATAPRGFLAQALTLGTGSTAVGVIVVAVLAAIIGYALYRRKRGQQQ